MRPYSKMRDRYNNSNEYEEEGEEEQEEVRVPPKPTKEEKEFLSIREKLKQKFRQKLLKERASTFGQSALQETPKTSSQDKFGSFFGPSLHGIAPRVIEGAKSIKNGYLHSSSKSSGSSTTVCVPVNEVNLLMDCFRSCQFVLGCLSFEAWVSLHAIDLSTSKPSSTKHIKEASKGHLKQQLQRQGTSRQPPLPKSNRPKHISNGSHRPSPSTGAKRPFNDKDNNAIDIIRKMFNYNPQRWAGRDEDDSDMVVGFDGILKEERRSSKLARKEDEEQLRLIEEEEKRERMGKKQKLRHG
ncbi:SPT2 chromatin protein [Carex littledalei]|uniref:SPT2 chromatin protein n=1 Tax=Carex littledalei TaxID=544730 RepID=A0A833RMY1_9POAL|nr:SPT2 chromatin protein [Carex littledalei]